MPHSTTCELCPLCQPYCLQSESSNCPLIPGHLISHLKVNPLVELKECKIPTGWDYNRWIIRICWVTIISIVDEVSWESLALWGMYPTFYTNNQLNYGHTNSRTVISSRQDKSARFSVGKETHRQAQYDIHNEISEGAAQQKLESVFNWMLLIAWCKEEWFKSLRYWLKKHQRCWSSKWVMKYKRWIEGKLATEESVLFKIMTFKVLSPHLLSSSSLKCELEIWIGEYWSVTTEKDITRQRKENVLYCLRSPCD